MLTVIQTLTICIFTSLLILAIAIAVQYVKDREWRKTWYKGEK